MTVALTVCACLCSICVIQLHVHTYTRAVIFLTVFAMTAHCRKFGKPGIYEGSIDPVTHLAEKHFEEFVCSLPGFCGIHTHVIHTHGIVSCGGGRPGPCVSRCWHLSPSPESLGSLRCWMLSQGELQAASDAGAHCLFSHSPWAVEATSDLCPWAWHPLLLNQPCPPCSKPNLLTLGCVKKSTAFICRATSKENGQPMLERPNPLTGFQGRGFKGNIWDEGCSSCTLLLIGWW